MKVLTRTYTVTTFIYEDCGETKMFQQPNLCNQEIEDLKWWLLPEKPFAQFRENRFMKSICETLHKNFFGNLTYVDDLTRDVVMDHSPSDHARLTGEYTDEFRNDLEEKLYFMAAHGLVNLHYRSENVEVNGNYTRTIIDDIDIVEVTRIGSVFFELCYGYRRDTEGHIVTSKLTK